MKKRILTALMAMVMTISLVTGCSDNPAPADTSPDTQPSQTQLTEPVQESADTLSASDTAQSSEHFIMPAMPAYAGKPYCTVNEGTPFFTDAEKQQTASFEQYAPLDDLGRCGTAVANIGPDLMPTEERGSIGQVKPAGWHTVKYDCVDGKYLYNRCHLIGYQLTGENANTANLITGTRYLNTEGMLPFENMTADYIKETGNHVFYRVTPVFTGDNLVADGVLMEGWSIEDQGQGICFNVYCYNVQPGVTIDYATGDSTADTPEAEPAPAPQQEAKPASKAETAPQQEAKPASKAETAPQQEAKPAAKPTPAPTPTPAPAPKPVPKPEPVPEPAPAPGTDYILNTNSHKFHYPSCSSVGQMKESNKEYFTGSREDVIARGYDPCGRCHP